MEVRLGWLLVWGGNPTELWNFAGPSAGVEPFNSSLLTGLERRVNEHLGKRSCWVKGPDS